VNGTIVQGHRVFVIATTGDETRHALAVGQALAAGAKADLSVVVPVPERVTVSSARAGVHDLPVDDLSRPDPELSHGAVRRLAERLGTHPSKPRSCVA
jgi:hypothetical protein